MEPTPPALTWFWDVEAGLAVVAGVKDSATIHRTCDLANTALYPGGGWCVTP